MVNNVVFVAWISGIRRKGRAYLQESILPNLKSNPQILPKFTAKEKKEGLKV